MVAGRFHRHAALLVYKAFSRTGPDADELAGQPLDLGTGRDAEQADGSITISLASLQAPSGVDITSWSLEERAGRERSRCSYRIDS